MKNSNLVLAMVSLGAILAACAGGGGGGHGGGGGGGGSGVTNPVPGITSISPANGLTADAASQGSLQLLTINGTNFIKNSSVLWNGTPLGAVALVNAGQLTVPVPASELQATGTASVVVSNPTPGGGNSSAVVVNINPPTPGTLTLTPASAGALSGGSELQVTATGVVVNSVVIWNNGGANAQALNTRLTTPPTSTGGAGTLTAVVANSLIASQGMVPVAVANPNADGSITSALSGNANFAVTAPVMTACLLAGKGAGAPAYRNYAFVGTGTDVSGAASMAGSFRIDASGALVNTPNPNIVNSFTDFKDAANLFAVSNGGTQGRMSGGAGSCVDDSRVPGTGKLQFTVSGIPGDTFTFNYTLRANGNGGRITLTDTLYGLQATGQIEIQFSTQAFGLGSFAFGLLGRNAANSRYAVVGAMCTGSPVFLQADFNDDATSGTPSTATAGGWSFDNGDATTGRATTSQLSFTNGRSLLLTLYGVGGGKAFAIESSPVATTKQVLSGVISGFKGMLCLPTGNGASFGNVSLVNSVFGLSSEATGMASVMLGVVNGIAPGGGGGCTSGHGSASLSADENASGTAGTITATPACYSVTSQGRATLTFTDPNTMKADTGVFYLDGAGNGYLLSEGAAIQYGFIQSQSTPAPLPAISGNYGFAPFNFFAGLLPVTSVAITGPSITDNAAGGSMTTLPYALDTTTGRGTATLNNATTFGDTQVVFYEAGGRQLYIMDQTAAAPVIGALIQ